MTHVESMATLTPSTVAATDWRWRGAAYAWATIVALGLSYFVVRIPVQLSDCLANLIGAQDQSWTEAMLGGIGGGYLRPLLGAQIKAVFELSYGHYTPFFRGIHLVQIVACAVLFVGALRVRDRAAALAVPFGLAVLFGGHTFDGTIREAFPINTFLTVVLACLAAVNLSFGQPARWRDVAAVVLFGATLLTVESGVLVFVCFAVAWMTGARGVSGRAVGAAAAILCAYVACRFLLLDVGTPNLLERKSGFGFSSLEPQELKARFGTFPYVFYAYNIASQALSVLMSEPRNGTWTFTRDVLAGTVRPAQIIAVVTSLGATVLIGMFAASAWHGWRRREFSDHDRLVIIFAAVLVANSVVSFPYAKDVVASPAGVFHALAATVAIRSLLIRLATVRQPVVLTTSVVLALLSAGWTLRLVGVHYQMREASFITRNDWTELDNWARRNNIDITQPKRAALARTLFQDALKQRPPAPQFNDRAAGRLVRYLF